jgi:hypothetical protein
MAAAGAEPVATAESPPAPSVATLQGFSSAGLPQPPSPLATAQGSGQGPSPFSASSALAPPESQPFGPPPVSDEPSAVVAIANHFQAMPPASMPIAETHAAPAKKSRTPIFIGIGAFVVVVGAVGGFLALKGGGDRKDDTTTAASGTPGKPAGDNPGDKPVADKPGGADKAIAPAGAPDPNAGFELYTEPAGASAKLDGSPLPHATPLKTSNIVPGTHSLEVSLAGYKTITQSIEIKAGEQSRVDVKLDPSAVAARFSSEPPGAHVTLVSEAGRQTVGDTPAEAQLDPTKHYQVVFEKDGYVTVTRDVDPVKDLTAAGGNELPVAVVLDRAQIAQITAPGGGTAHPPGGGGAHPGGGAHQITPKDTTPKDTTPKDTTPKDTTPKDTTPKDTTPKDVAPSGSGTLMIGAKPQCKIYIDGKDTGLSTPQRALEVKAGTRRITLVNNDFNIKETFSVDVEPGQTAKVIKDYSDKIGAQ